MAGYWGNVAATRRALVLGWLRTDDLGSLDHLGRLRLHGRRDNAYVRGGYNVHPEVVETVLRGHPDVADVAVVPRPDPVLGEIGVAVVVTRAEAPPLALEDLRRHAADRLAHHELPESLLLVDELPRSAVDKVDRQHLRRHLASLWRQE